MSIKIKWIAGDPNVTEYRIYRSTKKFTGQNLPPLLVTLPSNVFEFEDTDVAQSQLYWYAIAGVKGSKESLSFSKPMAYNRVMGPGPQTLTRGDWEYGFFGVMELNEFISYNNLFALIVEQGLPLSSTVPTSVDEYWFKFASRGRIIYMCSSQLSYSLTWKALYEAGVAGGGAPAEDIPQQVKDAYGTVTKDLRIMINDLQYRVRLPEARDDWKGTSDSVDVYTPGSRRSGEISRLFVSCYKVFSTTYPNMSYPPIYPIDPPFWYNANGRASNSGPIGREMYLDKADTVMIHTWENNSITEIMPRSATVTSPGWFQPVIELIQE